jgi:ATP-binding cassette subfamily B protein
MFMMFFKAHRQTDQMNCGSTCLAMICRHHGKLFSNEFLENLCQIGRQGLSMLNLKKAAASLGFRTLGVKLTVDQFIEQAQTPCILHWENQHYVVAYKTTAKKIKIADPELGKRTLSREEFSQHWQKTTDQQGYALLLEPTDAFYQQTEPGIDEQANNHQFANIINQLKPHRSLLWQLLMGIFAVTLINLIIPFLSQALIDQGVGQMDHQFITVILLAQLTFVFSRTVVEFIRSWILLHISTRINIAILAGFLLKLMRLPLSYFDKKNQGDILQRMGDHQRIEQLLTSHSLNTLFSLLNLLVFGVVLWIYNALVFWVFFASTVLALLWPLLFLKKRKVIDARKFQLSGDHHNFLLQLIHGMPEIKMNQADGHKITHWYQLQQKLFHSKSGLLKTEQFQQVGTVLINEVKNVLVIFLAAKLVISGQITIGTLVAITYIMGQLNGPIDQLLNFIPTLQNASLSLQRLNEIQNLETESTQPSLSAEGISGDLKVRKLNFAYPGFDPVLHDVSLTVKGGHVTALVGASGSGKSTLLKLLLKFYPPDSGGLHLGAHDYRQLSAEQLRSAVSVVFQDPFIFDDDIAANVVVNGAKADPERLTQALKMANLYDEIDRLPQKWHTVIGQNGQYNLSKGQQQRLMIARAVYSDPEYLFFDEATSALDATNEKIIQENLSRFMKNRTALIIAHRLSTVKRADQIIVMKQGRVVETGRHEELVSRKSHYYELVKNQLELGS